MKLLRSLLSALRPKSEKRAIVYGLQPKQEKGYAYCTYGRIPGAIYTYKLACKIVPLHSKPIDLLPTNGTNQQVVEYILAAERRGAYAGAARILFTFPPNYEILFVGTFGRQTVTLIHRYVALRDRSKLSNSIAVAICQFMATQAVNPEVKEYLVRENFYTTLFWHNAILSKYLDLVYPARFGR